MKQELTSLDLYYLVRELKNELEGTKLDKVYEQEAEKGDESPISKLVSSDEKKDFLFVFRKPGTAKKLLRIKLPKLAYLTEYKPDFPESPPGFCMFLRKHLLNARVKEIRQRGFERILEILFEVKEGERLLVCELFSKGNMLLLDHEMKIKGLLESQNWESRIIRGGTKYQYPPEQVDTPRLSMADYEKIVTSTSMDQIVKCFAVELGLGGFYAEELCRRSAIPKEKKRLNYDELQKSYLELSRLFRMDFFPNVSGEEILPFKTHSEPSTSYETFSQAIDESLTEKIEHAKGHKEDKEKVTKHKKISLVIEKQQERLDELEKEITESQRKGELIYENYTEVKELLDNINSDRKKMDWEQLKKKYKDVEIDEKKGTVTIDLQS